MCAIHLTPEISEFLKEAIERLNAHPRDVNKAAKVLVEAITRAEAGDPRLSPASAYATLGRRRLMLEQLCYYLGNIESGSAQTFLMERMEREPDDWVKRGIVVGLAFGGQDKPQKRYIAELRAERLSGAATPMNNVNIGFHLSFFGDQPYDPEYPDRDMGFEECGKTVDRLVYQLGTNTNRPNWQIDLYTLLDLRYRTASRGSYWAHVKANSTRLQRLYDRLIDSPETGTWQETADLKLVLSEAINGK
jgi:hypothetical protein